MQSITPMLSFSFYREANKDLVTNYIKDFYYSFTLQERKACDQMLEYINNLN